MEEKELLTIYLDNIESEKLLSFLEMLQKQYSFLRLISINTSSSITNINKTHILISSDDASLIDWEKRGGKSIKYNVEHHNRYGGISINEDFTLEILKRYLNLY